MHKCLRIDLLKCPSETKVSGESAMLRASLLFPFILFSARGKKAAPPWKKGVITVHTRGLSTKKISAHFGCLFQSPLFHLSQAISPPWWFPSFFFCTLPPQWCASCQGQREVLVKRRLGIKKTTTVSGRRKCLSVLRFLCTYFEMMEEKDHVW